MMAKLINELVVVDIASTFVQHYAPISAAFLSINPKIHGELLPTAPWTQVHPQHHDLMLMSIVTTQNLRSTTTKTQIATYMSHSSKPIPKSVMLLLHKSKPKPI